LLLPQRFPSRSSSTRNPCRMGRSSASRRCFVDSSKSLGRDSSGRGYALAASARGIAAWRAAARRPPPPGGPLIFQFCPQPHPQIPCSRSFLGFGGCAFTAHEFTHVGFAVFANRLANRLANRWCVSSANRWSANRVVSRRGGGSLFFGYLLFPN